MPLPEPIIVESRQSLLSVDLRTASCTGQPPSCRVGGIPAHPSVGFTIGIVAERCIGCGVCSEQCPGQAITLAAGKVLRDKTRCNGCGNCVEVCPVAVYKTG